MAAIMPPAADAGYRQAPGALLLACALLAAGCEAPRPESSPTPPYTVETAAAPGTAHPEPSATAAQLVAGFLAVDVSRVRVLDVTAEVFPDASLGCPEPDMLYAQVLTPGWRVLAEAEGRRFDVRVAGGGGRICHRKALPSPTTRSNLTPTDQAAQLARDDLATRTGASPDAVRVLGYWPVAAGAEVPGCAIDCAEDATHCGLLLELELDERRYRYHVHAGQARPCNTISPR